MAQADFGTGKTLAVLAIVLGCFAVLWPKIFYPMWQAAFALTSPKTDSDGRAFRDGDRPPHMHPGSINRHMADGVTPENMHEKFLMREGRPFPNPQSRQPVKSPPKSGGAMGIIMPIYTVGIIVFFIYTVLKLVFKKSPEESKKPLIKDFHMDPEYHKFVFEQTNEIKKPKTIKRKKKSNLCNTTIPETGNELKAEELDAKDYEIYKLKKKLEETEKAMERIVEHMGSVTVKAEKLDTATKLRNRRKGKSKKSETDSAKKWCILEEESVDTTQETLYAKSNEELEEDLSQLLEMCTATEASIKSFDSTPSDPIEEGEESAEEEEESSEEEVDSLLEDTTPKRKVPCA